MVVRGTDSASWLVHFTPKQTVQVQALVGDINFCCVLGQDTLRSAHTRGLVP